jgi:hypothetical protein
MDEPVIQEIEMEDKMNEKVRILVKKFGYGLMLLIVCAVTASCAGPGTTGPETWIDNPRDGASIQPGTAVTVKSHVFAKGGVTEIVLSVNGEAYRRDVPPDGSSEFISIKQDWTPDKPGTYRLQVQGFDSLGKPSNPASVLVEVKGKTEVAVVNPVISVTPVNTITPTATVTPTRMISITPEFTKTPTIPPASNVSFYAKPESLKAGECTTMYWAVQNAQRVIFGGKDQPFVGSYNDCLCSTQRFSLRVINLDGTETTHAVTINVTGDCATDVPPVEDDGDAGPAPAVDKTPPSVPVPVVPANGLTVPCKTNQTLVWQPSQDDASGIAGYYVKLEIQVKKGVWQSAGGYGPVKDKQVDVKVQCGGIYRWMVRAQDGAGNASAWSAPSAFSVVLN